MPLQHTLSIIKPDAIAKNIIGEIYARFERGGLKIVAAKMLYLSRERAEQFYSVHKGRPFFNGLVTFMTSGPILVQVLEGEDAIGRNREIMGATDPKAAAAGTIRFDFAESKQRNSVHGSDSRETAREEIGFFFREDEICISDGLASLEVAAQ